MRGRLYGFDVLPGPKIVKGIDAILVMQCGVEDTVSAAFRPENRSSAISRKYFLLHEIALGSRTP